jgi:fatty-acyl-CoA synthase
VYPREIEEFLYTHAAIADVQVVGVPDPTYGEEICAWVVPHAGAHATEDDIRAFCHGKIATYKIPRYVRFVDAFPTTVTGKVQKFRLREMAAEDLTGV